MVDIIAFTIPNTPAVHALVCLAIALSMFGTYKFLDNMNFFIKHRKEVVEYIRAWRNGHE
jgi:hypothetical protein